MRQIETSRTLVFTSDVHARTFFEALLCENMDLSRPENVELLFRRGYRAGRPASPPPGGFKTKIDRYCELITLNVFYKNSRLKQYLKDGLALRIETVVNNPRDLGCDRLLHNMPDLQAKARANCDRLLHTETASYQRRTTRPGTTCLPAASHSTSSAAEDEEPQLTTRGSSRPTAQPRREHAQNFPSSWR